MSKMSHPWFVYILRCADGTLYTGISPDVKAREKTHNLGKASKYTRVRLPVEVVYIEEQEDRSSASKREAQIKKLSREKKEAMVIKSSGGSR